MLSVEIRRFFYMTDVQPTLPLPTRPVAPSSIPGVPALFAVSSLTLAVTGVALFVILGLGVAFLASQNRGKVQDGDSEVQRNCRVIQQALKQFESKDQTTVLAKEFFDKMGNVTPENIVEAAQLLNNLKEIDPCVSLSDEANRILQDYGFNASQSSPIPGPNYSRNPRGISDGQLINEQDDERDLYEAIDRSNKDQENIRESKRKEQEAIKESEKLAQKAKEEKVRRAEEEERQRLEAEKQKRIDTYRKDPKKTCEKLNQDMEKKILELEKIETSIGTIRNVLQRYGRLKMYDNDTSAEYLKNKSLEEEFVKKISSQYENEFLDQFEEVVGALGYLGEVRSAITTLRQNYSKYTSLLVIVNKGLTDKILVRDRWLKALGEASASKPFLPLEENKGANGDKDDHGGDDREGVLVASDGKANVHSVEGGDHRGDAKDDSKRG